MGEKMFETRKYLNAAERSQLSRLLAVSEQQVKIWFQNRRTKWKKQENITNEQAASILKAKTTERTSCAESHESHAELKCDYESDNYAHPPLPLEGTKQLSSVNQVSASSLTRYEMGDSMERKMGGNSLERKMGNSLERRRDTGGKLPKEEGTMSLLLKKQEKEERRISTLLIDKDFGRNEEIGKHHFDEEVLDKKN